MSLAPVAVIKCPRSLSARLSEARDWWVQGRFCSCCGSATPDVVIGAILAGAAVITKPPTEPSQIAGKRFYFDHFGDGHRMKFTALLSAGRVNFAEGFEIWLPPFVMGIG